MARRAGAWSSSPGRLREPLPHGLAVGGPAGQRPGGSDVAVVVLAVGRPAARGGRGGEVPLDRVEDGQALGDEAGGELTEALRAVEDVDIGPGEAAGGFLDDLRKLVD